MSTLKLSCRCGTVNGQLSDVGPSRGTRLVCYCDSCQAFARHLAAEDCLDAHGGSDIYQLPPSRLQIEAGLDQLRCLRLSDKGITRWYSDCCKTPLINMPTPGMPMLGILKGFAASNEEWADKLGEVRFYVQGQSAQGEPEGRPLHSAFPLRLILRIIGKVFVASLSGGGKPNVLKRDDGELLREPEVLRHP